ncbi:MAG TPA: hypothetical protein VGL56_00420 [Fimbriimonadaceae bacterium]|jgi:hypothetical protein
MSDVEDISFVFGDFLCSVEQQDSREFGKEKNGAIVLPYGEGLQSFAKINVHKPLSVDYELFVELAWWSPSGPRILLQQERLRLYVGYDFFVCCLDLDEQCLSTTLHLDGCFWEFLPLADGRLVCLHEAGAACLGADGGLFWDVDLGDMLTDFSVKKGVLHLQGEEILMKVDLDSGKSA